jgi:hypothetical protein
MSMAAVRDVLQLGGLNVLYPTVLEQVLRWLPIALVLATPAAVILSRGGRYRVRHLPAWLCLLAAALLVALGAQALSQAVGWALGSRPPVIEFFNALRLAMLPLYVLLAHAAVHLVRVTRHHRGWVRAALGLGAAVYLGFCWNTRTLRHMVQDAIAGLAQEPPPAPAEPRDAADRELRLLAGWIKEQTPPDALVVTDRAEVRLYARRSVLCCQADVRYLYHLAPSRLTPWARRLRQQRQLLSPAERARADAAAIVAFADAHWAIQGRLPAPTYVLIGGGAAPAPAGRLEEIPAPGGIRGRHWRLLVVRPARATTTPALTTRPDGT